MIYYCIGHNAQDKLIIYMTQGINSMEMLLTCISL